MSTLKTGLISIFISGIALLVSAQKTTPVYLDVTKPIEERVENALSLMTTEEKVALCHGTTMCRLLYKDGTWVQKPGMLWPILFPVR